MKRYILLIVGIQLLTFSLFAQTVTIQIDANAGKIPISPYIFGKNNSLSDAVGTPLAAPVWQKFKDAGLKMFRENGGNNATKYNWRLKLSSHPDWYNNVYGHDWDYVSKSLQTNMNGVACLWAFQLIGKVASNKNNNFNDWAYNSSQWWTGCGQNLAGGGVVNASGGSVATTNGNPDLYLKNWPADSTVEVLNHWFGTNGLGLNKNIFRYWNMDNEPEIWNGTHDDIMATQPTAEEFMQKYFEVAKKARALYPEIKLCGPVTCNEWQWYAWNSNLILYNGKNYTWLEYFIKRIAEEQTSSGIKLLDVLDIHFYPSESAVSDILQLHRVFYDKNYNYPGANGLKKINGGWDNSQTKEYIFERCKTWLNTYLGANHGITMALSEMDVNSTTPAVVANWYASMLGTFADNGVEFFTPWSWKTGMWETLHLFSRYSKSDRIKSTSSDETNFSAYSSISADLDSITVILVNRSQSSTYNATINLSNFKALDGACNTLTLSNLSSSETFISHTQNALVSSTVNISSNSFTVSVPPLGIKAILIPGDLTATKNLKYQDNQLIVKQMNYKTLMINYTLNKSENVKLEIINIKGQSIQVLKNEKQIRGNYDISFDGSFLPDGIYLIRLNTGSEIITKKIIIQ
jgi:hypothetical protein